MAGLRDYKPLRLMAADADDLNVLSSVLQDAVVKIKDIAFDPDARRFALVLNRFVWECVASGKSNMFARVRTGCHFDDVISVSHQAIRQQAGEAVLDLLAVRFELGDDGDGAIYLDFAGGGGIRLDVESVNVAVRDLTDPWPTKSRPDHSSDA